MIMNIGAANAARTPLLVIASNKTIGEDDTEHGIQTAYQQVQTDGLEEVGKADDHPKPNLRVFGLRIPPTEDRHPQARSP